MSRHEVARLAVGRRLTGVLALAVIGLAGCGGSASTSVVIQVGSNAITKAMVEHWIPVVAIKDYELTPYNSVPRWVVLDPPRYTACIDHLQASSGSSTLPVSAAKVKALKAKCRQQYAALRQQALDFLITCEWLISEGERRGLKVTSDEVEHRFERVIKDDYGIRTAFDRYAAATGETVADQLFRSRAKVFSEKIERQFNAKAGLSASQRGQVYAKWVAGFPSRWAARTNCRPGYVVSNCRQYKGPSAPQIVL